MRQILFFAIIFLFSLPVIADNNVISEEHEPNFEEGFEEEFVETEFLDNDEPVFEEDDFSGEMEFDSDESLDADVKDPSLLSQLIQPARFTIKHEVSWPGGQPQVFPQG